MLTKQRRRAITWLGMIVTVLIWVFVSNLPAFGQEKLTLKREFPQIKDAEYVGSESCGACHEKEHKEFLKSTHSRISIASEDVKMQGCEMCHGPASKHVDASGGKDNIINPKYHPETCFQCHMDKKAEFRLPNHHPVLEGKMSCTSCHSAHGEEARPWSSTTIQDVNEACFKCHKDQRGPFVFEHEVLREGCTTCHSVHGSLNEKMLIVRDSNLCLRCHTQSNFPTIGKSNHGTGVNPRLMQGTCFSGGCHTAVHGSNFDEHLRY
jgi:predicted CXXCH cytochrome family protein